MYFHSCTLCPHPTQICTSFLHCYKAEAIMLTVASLQSLFNGTSVPASLGTVTGGRWGDWLWLCMDQRAAAHIHYAKICTSSLKSAETHSPLWTPQFNAWLSQLWMVAVWSVWKCSKQKDIISSRRCYSHAYLVTLLLTRQNRILSQLKTPAMETSLNISYGLLLCSLSCHILCSQHYIFS